MKIVIPVLSVTAAGGFRVLCELSSEWVRNGHSVAILALWFGGKPYFQTLAEIIWVDDSGRRITPDKANCAPKRAGVRYVYHNLMALWRGLRYHAKDADVILANHNLTAWPVFLNTIACSKIYYIQAYEPEIVNRFLLKSIAYTSYFLPLRQIANSPFYINYKNVRANDFVPPGIDLSVMFPLNSQDQLREKIIIGCVGSKQWFKGLDDVSEACRLLEERGVQFEIRLAYGLLPEGCSMPPDVKIIRPRNDRELGDFYRALDILIAPGKLQHGSAHYPVMEAMACGIAVITTGYLPASEEANNSWIVPVNDPRAIADAVEDMVANPRLRRERIKKALNDIRDFSWDKVAAKMLSLFNK
jgi:glycosyltransferase involved in cell wall biosynthesis